MRILYDNLLTTTTQIDYSSQNLNYAQWTTSLFDRRLAVYSVFNDITSEWIRIDLVTAKQIDYIAIYNHTIDGTVTIQANTTDSWGTPAYSATLNKDLDGDGSIDKILLHPYSGTNYRYWRILVATNTVPAQIGYIFIGRYYQPPEFSSVIDLPYKSRSTYNKSLTGQISGNKLTRLRSMKFTFNSIQDTDRKNLITIYDDVDTVFPVTLIVFEDSLAIEAPIYCNFTDFGNFRKEEISGALYSESFAVEECK